MRKLWVMIGRVTFWLVWPLLWLYLKRGKRTRVLLHHKNEILLVRGWLSSGKWSLPGGGLHSGEDPKQGALRELKEETGITKTNADLHLLGSGSSNQYGLAFSYYAFVIACGVKPKLKLQKHEIIDAWWFPVHSITPDLVERSTLDVLANWQQSS